jgi:hypothetical protein
MMKKLLVLIAMTGFVILSFNVKAFSWDPSGTWGISGRTDATLKISCVGDACTASFQSDYSKAKATGYVLNDKLALAYNEYTTHGIYFMTFEKQGDTKMSKKTFYLDGKNIGGENWVRK